MIVERKLNRLSGYDYSTAGAYFITTNTNNREPVFGEINNGKIELNDCGIILKQQWEWLFKQYDYITRDEYVIMPDHFHGIIHIAGNNHAGNHRVDAGNGRVAAGNGREKRNGHDRSLQVSKIKPLPELIGAFKTTSSKLIHLAGKTDFKWQKSYHDRIIRDEEEMNRIRQYIIDNPTRWGLDDDECGDGFGG